MRPLRTAAWVLGVALLGACTAPELRTRYSPLHPDTGVDVTFQVQASAEAGISKVELFLYEYEVAYVDSEPVGKARPGGTWGLVEEWKYVPAYPTSVELDYVHPGFPEGSYVTFLFQVTTTMGVSGSESWSLAAGKWNFGTDPIPILVNGPTMWRIDLCFVADKDDYADGRAMLADLEQLVYDGYQESNALEGEARQYWQYYYSPELGTIGPPDSALLDIPDAVKYSTIVDAGAVIHTTEKQDWSAWWFFGSEPSHVGTALHESGHAVFNLDDEYPGGRHHASDDPARPVGPHHNNYDSQEKAEKYNDLMGWPTSEAEFIETDAVGDWWRPEPKAHECIMVDDQMEELPDFGRTCIRRIQWYYSLFTEKTWLVEIDYPL